MPLGRTTATRILLGTIIAAGAACAQGSPPEPAEPLRIELPARLVWPTVDGAVEYRVQVWDGTRLLFEEVRVGNSLEPTESMQRSLRGAATAELQVRAIGSDGLPVGGVHREDLGPVGG